MAEAVDIKSTIFGTTTRTPYCVWDPDRKGGAGDWVLNNWLQDVYHPPFILHYTTSNGGGPGRVGVFEVDNGNLYARAEKTIIANEHGHPIEVTGVQRYFPKKLIGPIYLPDGGFAWNTISGTWGWCTGNCSPTSGDRGNYRFDNALHGTSLNFYWDSEYFQDREVGDSPPPITYKRTNVYDGTPGRPLQRIVDRIRGVTLYRFNSVRLDNSCFN